MECRGCGEWIDEENETITHDYVGDEWHEECLQKETHRSIKL